MKPIDFLWKLAANILLSSILNPSLLSTLFSVQRACVWVTSIPVVQRLVSNVQVLAIVEGKQT